MKRINVTRTFLPPIEEYERYIHAIWDRVQLTNQGPLLKEFEESAREYLGVKNFQFVSNGTMALQLAIRALDITEGEIITTPFSYVATTSSILWERCEPVFVDIDPETLTIDPEKIERAITDKTRAIMPVHVFGNPCDVEAIEKIAAKHKLKIIYDAAHAFGVNYKDKPVLAYGDVSVCSFHSTKPFHTIEGGGVVARDQKISDKIELMKRFGHNSDEHYTLGINAKASEFQAAMGLCNLKYIDGIIEKRRQLSGLYDKLIGGGLQRPVIRKGTKYNYAYYPVIFESEKVLEAMIKKLEKYNIFPRRYFYPSLNTLPYLKTGQSCPMSEDIAKRIACLPLYVDLEEETINLICKVIKK